MAERPVFLPSQVGTLLVQEVPVAFHWHPGMAPSQKRKNVRELHAAAARLGFGPLLETSSKSEFEGGRRLSAFYLPLVGEDRTMTVESAFQGSKVFEFGGPYTDLYGRESREAKLDSRLKSSGRLTAFQFAGQTFPLSPPTLFYDWIYTQALYPHREWLRRLERFEGFTDIEFNPKFSINCQARSCALFVALRRRGLLDAAMSSFDSFREIHAAAYI